MLRDADVSSPGPLLRALNSLITLLKSTQQPRLVVRSFPHIQPSPATGNPWSLVVKNPGFAVGGVVLSGFRNEATGKAPEAAWAVDWVVQQNGDVNVSGRLPTGTTPTANAHFRATVVLFEERS